MPNSGFYLMKEKKSHLEYLAQGNRRKLVTETLKEIYGPNIVNFSAKGNSWNDNPVINYRLEK